MHALTCVHTPMYSLQNTTENTWCNKIIIYLNCAGAFGINYFHTVDERGDSEFPVTTIMSLIFG